MSYVTIPRQARERAAAAVYGTVTGLILGGQDDAARYVVDGLDTDLLRDVHGLVDERTDPALAAWLRERHDTGKPGTAAIVAGPDSVADEDDAAPMSLEEKVKRALRVKLTSTALKAVTSSGAFTVLVYRVGQAMDANTGVNPLDVLKEIGEGNLALAGGMTDPAAYLAKHVKQRWGLD